MEGLGVAANAFAVVSMAIQLSESCVKLYNFWESMEDAPHEIATIKVDLKYLISIFTRIETTDLHSGPCIAEGLHHCRAQIADLMSIVESLDSGFRSASRRKRLCTAFKAAIHGKHLQRFRESLNATKSTLILAMVHECVVQSPSHQATIQDSVSRFLPVQHVVDRESIHLKASRELRLAAQKQLRQSTPSLVEKRFLQALPVESQDVARTALVHFEKTIPDKVLAGFTIQELMLHAISQTAIATFQSSSLEIFAQDGYMMDECGQVRSKTFAYSESLRYRVRHQASSFRTALGCVWVRKTFISHANEVTGELEMSQTVTSFVFYPTWCMQLLGVRNGMEAIIASAGRSWVYNCKLTVTRAVPENSLIFELCSAGEIRAVQVLLETGQGSVVDTSPKGWKPLHYAAVGGHVELCAMLIRAGADKSSLVYEGPTESVLSPISLFVSHSTESSAEEKIKMLRLFCDCVDLSEAEGDGWVVHEWLKKAYAKERRPISQNSITWLLQVTAKEEYVEFSARNVWSALQHAIRSVLNHAHFSRMLERILELSQKERDDISQRHLEALGAWLALRVSNRVILPMVVNAGAFLQMRGFDWLDDGMPQRRFLQALPNVYAAWCLAVLDAVSQLEIYMRDELEQCFSHIGLTRGRFLEAISPSKWTSQYDHSQQRVCTQCQEDYTALGIGLVEPARMAITECVATGHDFDCNCQSYDNTATYTTRCELPTKTSTWHEDDIDDDVASDEEFADAEPYIFGPADSDVFSDVAIMLYRSHGRVWIGNYAIGEKLCGTCFFFREKYIGEDGLAADFSPIPRSFEGLRLKW